MSGSYNDLPYNIGRSGTVVFIGPTGTVALNYTDFKSEQMTHSVESRPVNGETIAGDLPDLWNGTIDIDRNSAGVDQMVALIEANYFAGQGLPLSNIYQYIDEVDGSQSIWQYTNVTFTLTSAGSWKQNDLVKQSIKFKASRRKQLS